MIIHTDLEIYGRKIVRKLETIYIYNFLIEREREKERDNAKREKEKERQQMCREK
jgi:hypothetical protein